MPAARSVPDANGLTPDDEVSGARRVVMEGSRARYVDELDEPFADEDALLPQFVSYLRAKGIAEIYLPAFELEARTFRARFRYVPTEQLDARLLDVHVNEGHLEALSDRALRNRRVAVEAYLDFLRRPRVAASPAPTADKRRARRVPFLTEVEVYDFGVVRSADLSTGGIYLDGLTTAPRGSLVHLRFKLRSSDVEPIRATARVTFVHPQFGAGLAFVSVRPDDARRIADFVASASATDL